MKEDAYFTAMRASFQRSRDRFSNAMSGLGFSVLPSSGTYFVTVDIAPLGETDDVSFCQRLVKDHGVAAIPVSAFYAQNPVRSVIRFCFAKKDSTLDAAIDRLSGLFRKVA